MPDLEYKRVPFELKQVVDVAGGGWEISGYASTWGDPPDSYGDVIAPGAFAASLAERQTKLLFEHAMPIGKQLELREDERGLFGRWAIIDTTAGTDAYKLARGGVLDSLSIGYQTEESEYRDDGVRVLKRVALFEVSAVAIPANPYAVITDVKDQRAVWSSGYVSNLPDSAFALIMPGGKKDDSGKTTPRSLRKLPHHDSSGSVDMPHLRNALSRAPQMTGVSDSQRSRAVGHLNKHMAAAQRAAHRLVPSRKDADWDDDEGISTFAEGSYEQLAEDLEEAYEAVAISSGQMGYVEVVATFPDRFVAVIVLLDADGDPNPVDAEDPVYWQVPYTVASDGTITLGQASQVEPETRFMPPDKSAPILNIRMELLRRTLEHHGVLERTS